MAKQRTNPNPNYDVIWEPQTGPQTALLACPVFEVFFGGARGGGKTDGVLGDWVSHQDLHGENAIGLMVRRERTQLIETIERSRQIYGPLGAKFNEQDKVWRFPNGSRLRFAYLERDSDADAYQGHSYTRVYVEEIGTFPSPSPILKLMATLRSGAGVPCGFRATGNPGGPGHQWVKARYIDPNPRGWQVFEHAFANPWSKEVITRDRVFIPSKLSDNRYLGSDYVANLQMVGSTNLVKAWLEGDWSVIEGAFFPEWSSERHIIAPFAIPPNWLRFRAMDWGSAHPFVVQWWAVVGDNESEGGGDGEPRGDSGQVQSVADWQRLYQETAGHSGPDRALSDRRDLTPVHNLPRGAIVCYREWYGGSAPNVGLKLPAEEVGQGIVSRETYDGQREQIVYGVLDPAAFASDGGPSIAERLARSAAYFRPADNRRVGLRGNLGGWDQVRARLKGNGDTVPMLYVFSTCRDLIRTLPALQHDADRPEDVDSTGDDHCPDTTRYACMSRPFVRALEAKAKPPLLGVGPHNQVTLNNLWDAQDALQKRERI